MHWKQLLLKKSIVGRIPFSGKLRELKRKLFGYTPDTSNLDLTIEGYELMKSALKREGESISDKVILEIGSGWFPIIPLLLLRDGAKKVIMSDQNVHMDEITFKETAGYLKRSFKTDRFIQSLSDFSSLPIEYLAPFDAEDISDKSLDLVVSRTVLEHIPKSDLYNLFFTLRPKVKDTGMMTHLIDYTDHFEHVDKSLSKINFLTWSEEKHALINFLIKDGENHLRHHEYQQIFLDSGYVVLNEELFVNDDVLEDIPKLDLVYPYSQMKPEQLAVTSSIYTAKPQ